ncbi:MAG TPA: hypothetical protein VH600_13280 [Burkholderiales bacterium]|jgi:hypothetical protein
MLVLEPEQLDTLEQHMLQTLRGRLKRVIAATFPELNGAGPSSAEADARLSTAIDRGMETAARYGIEEHADIAAFIALGLAWRTLPPETPTDWIKDWLERPDTPGDTKLAVIEAQLAGVTGNPALALVKQRVAQARREAGA